MNFELKAQELSKSSSAHVFLSEEKKISEIISKFHKCPSF